jgi:Na+-transporting NADH:ubiquinone oxidoreductase subunit F
MTPMMRKLHKWVGLLIAIQFVLWLGSGLVMSLFDHNVVMGHAASSHAKPPAWAGEGMAAPARVLAAAGREVDTIETAWLADRPVYRLASKSEVWLADAKTGERYMLAADDVAAIAARDYAGDGKPDAPVLLAGPSMEARKHRDKGPLWKVAFRDADNTTLYISSQDGKILERRNDTWRLFDIAWMLHIMDYAGREDFNNPLVIMAAGGGVWIALTGLWLLVTTFRLREFIPSRWLPARQVEVLYESGARFGVVKARAGDSVYLALAGKGIHLPSNCGGGQSCGLCEVRVRGAVAAPTSADREHIPAERLVAGYRLACNIVLNDDLQVEVKAGTGLRGEVTARVDSVTAVTPFLREIVLVPEAIDHSAFWPGCFVQLHIPAYQLDQADLFVPEHQRDAWEKLRLPRKLVSDAEVRRAYSLSLPTAKDTGKLHLLVRFSPGGDDQRCLPGRGSSYVYSLRPGDRVAFNGPFGQFAIRPGANEKVFIGGGAGMAPLRAMIHALLDAGSTEAIQFWYGARSIADAPYAEEMAALARRHGNFHWRLVLSDDHSMEPGHLHGFVHEVAWHGLLAAQVEVQQCDFYLCGPPAMLAATRALLAEKGIDDARVAYDDFKI